MEIKKIKILNNEVELSYSERKEDGTIKTVTEKHETRPHPDFLQAFANLRAHWALLTGYLSLKAVKKIETPNEELLEDFEVYAISVKTGDDPGVVISGKRLNILETKKSTTVNTPFTRLEEGEEPTYKFTDDLGERIERVEKELEAYLGGKRADDPQKTIEFPEADRPDKSNGHLQNLDLEDIEHEMVGEGDPNRGDPEIWKDGQRPK